MVAPRGRRLGDGTSDAGMAVRVRAAHPQDGCAPARARIEPQAVDLHQSDLWLCAPCTDRAEPLQHARSAMAAWCGQAQAHHRAPHETGRVASGRGRRTLLRLPVIYGERGHDAPWHAGRHLQRRPVPCYGAGGFRGEERARESCGRAPELPVAAFPAHRARTGRPRAGTCAKLADPCPGESAK